MWQLVLLACLSACAALTFPRQECGRTSIPPRIEEEDRIVDGTEAVPGSWPWHAGLHGHPFFDSHYFCGGVLVSNRYVLTAAHCVTLYDPKMTFVHLGSHLREIREDAEVSVPVEHMCMHKDEEKDIAIIKLAKEVNFTDTIQPACLPDARSELPDRTTLYVTGWGQTDEGDPQSRAEVLQQTKTLSVTNSRCRKEYKVSHDHEICTSHESGSTCHVSGSCYYNFLSSCISYRAAKVVEKSDERQKFGPLAWPGGGQCLPIPRVHILCRVVLREA